MPKEFTKENPTKQGALQNVGFYKILKETL